MRWNLCEFSVWILFFIKPSLMLNSLALIKMFIRNSSVTLNLFLLLNLTWKGVCYESVLDPIQGGFVIRDTPGASLTYITWYCIISFQKADRQATFYLRSFLIFHVISGYQFWKLVPRDMRFMNNLKMLRLDGFLIYVLYVLMKETYLKYTVLNCFEGKAVAIFH